MQESEAGDCRAIGKTALRCSDGCERLGPASRGLVEIFPDEDSSKSSHVVTRWNSAAYSMTQSRKVRGGVPVTCANSELTNAGWPMVAAQALRSISIAGAGMMVNSSRRASSGE